MENPNKQTQRNYSSKQEIELELPEYEKFDDNKADNLIHKESPSDNLDESGGLLKNDIGNIILLCVLYFYQGLILSFFLEYIQNYLIQEKKINGEKIAALRLVQWPYSFKFIWAPIMDTYYSKSFGRRKTYVVPAQFLISVTLLASSFDFGEWVEKQNVILISAIGFSCVFLLTIQDIAVDSWSVSLLHPKNVAYASFSQSFGQRIGNIFGYQLFLYLSDESFMQSVFGPGVNVITTQQMCLMISLSVLLGTLFILFCRKETKVPNIQSEYEQRANTEREEENQVEEQQPRSFCGMIQKIKSFFKNELILLLILFTMTTQMGHYCIDVPGGIILLNKGFNRSILATIELCLIPLTQIVSGIAAKLSQKKQEFKIWLWCYSIKFFWNFGNYYAIESYKKGQTQNYLIPLIILTTGDTILTTMPSISLSAFLLRVCDQSIGGTYITFINSFFNLGSLWPSLIISLLSSHIKFQYFMVIGIVLNICIFIFWRKRAIELQDSPKEKWQIKQS